MRYANADPESDVILLNNDTEIVQPDWIGALQEVAYSAPDIGVVGCRLVRPDGMLQHVGTYLPCRQFRRASRSAHAKETSISSQGTTRWKASCSHACT